MNQSQAERLEQVCANLRAEVARLEVENAALRRQANEIGGTLAAQQHERQLLGYEIHDGLVQDMTAASMFLATVEQQAAAGGSVSLETLQRGIELVRHGVIEARRLIGGLTPGVVDHRELRPALEELVERFREQQGLAVDFTAELASVHFEPNLQWTVLRIVQESLNNVFRHSHARAAEVRVVEQPGELEIVIRDAGRGFDTTAVAHDHFGLASIRERARQAGGSASIESSPGQGTCVTARLPL